MEMVASRPTVNFAQTAAPVQEIMDMGGSLFLPLFVVFKEAPIVLSLPIYLFHKI
jgi:hypothetical protein